MVVKGLVDVDETHRVLPVINAVLHTAWLHTNLTLRLLMREIEQKHRLPLDHGERQEG